MATGPMALAESTPAVLGASGTTGSDPRILLSAAYGGLQTQVPPACEIWSSFLWTSLCGWCTPTSCAPCMAAATSCPTAGSQHARGQDWNIIPKSYCCPIEGCPKSLGRPFSQFSLIKEHFMKMHAEKQHKCSECSSVYCTKCNLIRQGEECCKNFQCICHCPYPAEQHYRLISGMRSLQEHKDPPIKIKRKLPRKPEVI